MINQLSAVFIGLKKLFKFYPNGCMQDPTKKVDAQRTRLYDDEQHKRDWIRE